jgi:hypothetical protein
MNSDSHLYMPQSNQVLHVVNNSQSYRLDSLNIELISVTLKFKLKSAEVIVDDVFLNFILLFKFTFIFFYVLYFFLCIHKLISLHILQN